METDNRICDGSQYFPDNPDQAALFDRFAEELGGCETLRPQQAILLSDLVRSEGLKAKLEEDIARRGLGCDVTNGRQRYWRDNKSVTTLMKLMDQQRKNMQTLGLIAKDNQPKGEDGEEDDFDRL